ncbi:MAG TPA: D-amino acid dehydrogenase [Azospirillum sp.]
MRVIVLGAGIVGMASAYVLARDGHAVTVVDRAPGVGLEASFANGGQLSYSYVAPLAGPSVPKSIPGYLLRADSPLRFAPAADPHQWRWILRFLAACTETQSRLTTRRLLALGGLSRRMLHEAVDEHGPALDFAYARNGKLVVYSTAEGFASAQAQMAYQKELGSEQQAVDADGCVAIEPALATLRPRLTGGIHTPSEEVGDCHGLCESLRRILESGPASAVFRLGTTATSLRLEQGRVTGLDTDAGVIEADAVVLAAGVGSTRFARAAGLDLPIYPLKGYSVSAPMTNPAKAPRVSITDSARRIVYAPIGGDLRAAGIADLVGLDAAIHPRRLDLVVRETRAAFPGAADYDHIRPWSGLRPATPTGAPLLGPTPVPGLWLNTGHGALGFTLAMGSARIVADLMAGRPPEIPVDGFLV